MPTDPLAAALARPARRIDPGGARAAAVALVFGPSVDPYGELLLIRRAERAGDPWSGHVGLPGGHLEAGETFERAVVREAHEEVGLDLGAAALLGGLDDCATPVAVRTRVVRPFVYRAEALGPLQLQASEVAAAHRVPLERLLDGVGRGSFLYEYGGASWTMPCVDLPVGRLWGMTLRIVDDLLDRLDGQGIGLERPVR